MTTVYARTDDRIVGIFQSVKAGSNFAGAKPMDGATELVPVFANDTFTFAPATAAGLFFPPESYYAFESREATEVSGVELMLGDQTSWKIEKFDAAGNAVTAFSGGAEDNVMITEDVELVLLWGEYLKLTTVAATQVLKALIKFEPRKMQARRW